MKRAIVLFTINPADEACRKPFIERDKDVRLYTGFIDRVFSVTAGLRQQIDFDLIIACDRPAKDLVEKANRLPALRGSVSSLQQKGRNFAQRINHTTDNAFKMGYDHILIIGNDCPDLSATLIREAFCALNSDSVVLGPAIDGGVYLIGLVNDHTGVFRNVKWCTSAVYEGLSANIKTSDLSAYILPVLWDIDNPVVLNRWLRLKTSVNQKLREIICSLFTENEIRLTRLQLPASIKRLHVKRIWQKPPPGTFHFAYV